METEVTAMAVEASEDEIEYMDFTFIDAKPGILGRSVKFIDYLEWLMKDDFKAVKDRLEIGLMIKKTPKRDSDNIIEGIVTTTVKEFLKKANNSNYYECSYVAILQVLRHIFTEQVLDMLKIAYADEKTRFLTKNYQEILKEILINIEDLCSLYSEHMGDKRYKSHIASRYIHVQAVHQVLRQGLYGNVSLHAFNDRETTATIGTIRQLVELRIRRGFGVLAYEDTAGNLTPLDMNVFFEVIKDHEENISFPIRLENIIRIYRWANSFIHSGLADYPWIPMYLETALGELSFGKRHGSTWCVYNGIKTDLETIVKIQQDLLNRKNSEKYKLYQCKPECDIIDGENQSSK